MNPLMLIKGELRRSFGGILALALVLALSLSLGVGVSMTERAVRQGTARAGDAFDLLVGAQGSSVHWGSDRFGTRGISASAGNPFARRVVRGRFSLSECGDQFGTD